MAERAAGIAADDAPAKDAGAGGLRHRVARAGASAARELPALAAGLSALAAGPATSAARRAGALCERHDGGRKRQRDAQRCSASFHERPRCPARSVGQGFSPAIRRRESSPGRPFFQPAIRNPQSATNHQSVSAFDARSSAAEIFVTAAATPALSPASIASPSAGSRSGA